MALEYCRREGAFTVLVTGKGVHYVWSGDISPRLERAVIAAEDQNFCRHNGFDWEAIDKAMKDHQRNPKKRLRGASTISQQAARTLFLVPMRSWIRKGLETYLTVLIEALWPKQRILEAYLNLVDWGDGIFGAEAAARTYFGTDASSLTSARRRGWPPSCPIPTAGGPQGRAAMSPAGPRICRAAAPWWCATD
jgi:monofunctional biosynthetic peptidoglycan transglycosylase